MLTQSSRRRSRKVSFLRTQQQFVMFFLHSMGMLFLPKFHFNLVETVIQFKFVFLTGKETLPKELKKSPGDINHNLHFFQTIKLVFIQNQ